MGRPLKKEAEALKKELPKVDATFTGFHRLALITDSRGHVKQKSPAILSLARPLHNLVSLFGMRFLTHVRLAH